MANPPDGDVSYLYLLSWCAHGETATFSLAVHALSTRVMWARAGNAEQNLCPYGNAIMRVDVNALNFGQMRAGTR
jgi:hypothetical protein